MEYSPSKGGDNINRLIQLPDRSSAAKDFHQVTVREDISGSSSTSGDLSDKKSSDFNTSNSNSIDKITTSSSMMKSPRIEAEKSKSHNPGSQPQKPHFKIEWRQLTYFQKQSSFLGCGWQNEWQQQQRAGEGSPVAKPSQQQAPKRILNSLDGCFRSGELSAILGPSGAGKSTFLSTLFGSKQDSAYGQTKVTWFGPDQRPAIERRSIKIASLPQHDHLLNHLTVYETLMFASKIKNATRPMTGKGFHRQNVKRVAKMLKLTDCLDTRCGKLSGGQYKRVSIGQELLSEPDVIILDEPTSGLDAMTCLTTIQTLKSIVMRQPMSIILTIHQPDIDVFNLFDHIYVIAQGGLAIYEGPPKGIVPALAEVGLVSPSDSYNPARFIVENAFVFEPTSADGGQTLAATGSPSADPNAGETSQSEEEEDDIDGDDTDEDIGGGSYLKRSVLSLTEAISGKEMDSKLDLSKRKRRKDKRPLLNIGIQTLDGKLITSAQLIKNKDRQQESERWNLLKRLNQMQKARYRNRLDLNNTELRPGQQLDGQMSPLLSEPVSPDNPCLRSLATPSSPAPYVALDRQLNVDGKCQKSLTTSSAKSDYSSEAGSWTEGSNKNKGNKQVEFHREDGAINPHDRHSSPSASGYEDDENNQPTRALAKATSLALLRGGEVNGLSGSVAASRSLQVVSNEANFQDRGCSDRESILSEEFVSVNFAELDLMSQKTTTTTAECGIKPPVYEQTTRLLLEEEKQQQQVRSDNRKLISGMKRQFDKRLSAKHNCASKNNDYPVFYHAMLLTHRTWLSIVRDPIFFGIQFAMHTTIPILLALIFGNSQEEGCPRVGSFDLVEFAYSDSDNLIQGTVHSIRKSIGNIGIVFFEMFVLSFSINCITALVFPLDMYVLLKEYRNGWYSLRSYFFGRTLADLPIPIVLHSMAMGLLYFMTGQPHDPWRFAAIIALVIMASLVAQSVGLTIGALLMKSSQSAVLTAAAIVAPFFALSGFIVRIHTLPLVARFAAKCSYLYHLLNGFIILRYGYGRCECRLEDFEQNDAHQIPSNLHTLASMWIGTYSDEYSNSTVNATAATVANRTNVDPNIDVVDKMMTAFKMANSYGHQIRDCNDVLPYAMLDFNLRDGDIYGCFLTILIMIVVSRIITFLAIYFKVRSHT